MLFTLALFLGLSLFSYHPMDPSLNSLGNPSSVHNYCGYVGSFLSDLLYQLFGIHGWLLVYACLRWSSTCFFKHRRELSPSYPLYKTLSALALMVSLSGLVDMYFQEYRIFSQHILLSGLIGHSVANGLRFLFNPLGGQVLLWGACLVFWTLTGNRLAQWLCYLCGFGVHLCQKLQQLLPKRLLWFSGYILQPLARGLSGWQNLLWSLWDPEGYRENELFQASTTSDPSSSSYVSSVAFTSPVSSASPAAPDSSALSVTSLHTNSFGAASHHSPESVGVPSFSLKVLPSVGHQEQVAPEEVAREKYRGHEEHEKHEKHEKPEEHETQEGQAEQEGQVQGNKSETNPLPFILQPSKKRFSLLGFGEQKAMGATNTSPSFNAFGSFNWQQPPLELLDKPQARLHIQRDEIQLQARQLTEKLEQFAVQGQIKAIKPGPAVTLYEFQPNANIRLSKITDLAEDISMALSSESVRIIAPIPGRDVVGIEVANSEREKVFLREVVANPLFWKEDLCLPLALGKKVNGESNIIDLSKIPHLLIAGSTGSGKSVFTLSALCSLILRHSPHSLRLLLIDPKQVDLSVFASIPHLISPIVHDIQRAIIALKWAVTEMEKRYRSLHHFSARKLEDFNRTTSQLSPQAIARECAENETRDPFQQYYYRPQPHLVLVVEEFGDLMSVDKVNVEQLVIRLAQMARACGMHLVLAMQSPRKEILTGLIKTNIPGRISFKVASKTDSRIILDEGGAERLLAKGDMLFIAPGICKPERHHCPWLSEKEIQNITQFWSSQARPQFNDLLLGLMEKERQQGSRLGVSRSLGLAGLGSSVGSLTSSGLDMNRGTNRSSSSSLFADTEEMQDQLYLQIVEEMMAMKIKEISASLLQRKFRLGYPRAARMIEIMEKDGYISPAQGSKPRKVLINE